ncbi:hypothetical protein H0H93_013282, partial [Arthromyces matolae]
MKTLKLGIISAVGFTYLFLVAATPIPISYTATDSQVLPAEFDDKVPTITARIVTLPNVDIRANDEPALLSRATSEEISETRPLVIVPKELLQVPPESDPVMMRVPRASEYTSLHSVLRILNLMNVAVDKCDALKRPRDTFQAGLQKTRYLRSLEWLTFTINQHRFPESEEENLQVLDLKTLKHHITDAVKAQSMFQGEITIAGAFFPGGKKMGLKVPYPDNKEAVQSVDAILYLLHSGIPHGAQAGKLIRNLWRLKNRLQKVFKLDVDKQDLRKTMSLTPKERDAFEKQFNRVLGLHNNAEWISRDTE